MVSLEKRREIYGPRSLMLNFSPAKSPLTNHGQPQPRASSPRAVGTETWRKSCDFNMDPGTLDSCG